MRRFVQVRQKEECIKSTFKGGGNLSCYYQIPFSKASGGGVEIMVCESESVEK